MRVLFEGSIEQKMMGARVALLEYSKGKSDGLTLLSTFDNHMFVSTDSGRVLRLEYKDNLVQKQEDVTSIQSLRNPIVEMISEDVKRINRELDKEFTLDIKEQNDLELSKTIFQTENLVKLLTKCVILEQKAEEKGRSKRDITFFKKAMDFLDDLQTYLKRLIKESKEVPISYRLVEDLALSLAKIDTILR